MCKLKYLVKRFNSIIDFVFKFVNVYSHLFYSCFKEERTFEEFSQTHCSFLHVNFDVRNLNTKTSENKNRTYTTHEQYLGLKHRILIHEYENQVGEANVHFFTDRQYQYV